jgi:hypothetical protein
MLEFPHQTGVALLENYNFLSGDNLPQQPLKAARPTLFEWLFDT